MEIRFTVGELARLSGITKQMLIFYHREGVFCPKYVGENGYRYYTGEQLEILDSILILRELGIPLKEIKAHMQAPTAEKTKQLLENQKNLIQEKIQKLKALENKVSSKLQTLHLCEEPANQVLIQYLPKEYLLLQKVKQPKTLLDLDIAIKKLLKKVSQHNYPHNYQIGSIGLLSNIQNQQYSQYEYGFLPLQAKNSSGFKKDTLMKKEEGQYATMLYQGKYQGVGAGYERMLKEIEKQGYFPVSDCYEYSVLDSLTTKAPNEYLTQLQIQVRKK